MSQKSMKILVVEDEAALQNIAKKKLEQSGYQVEGAKSVEEAIQLLENQDFQLVWLDHYLVGRETGLDLLKNLRESKKTRRMPVLVISNTASEDKVEQYHSLGIEDYYVKANISLEDIVQRINSLLKT